MESSIGARYKKKCDEFKKKIEKLEGTFEQMEVEQEFVNYQIACMPFIEKLTANNQSTERTKINLSKVFKMSVEENTEDSEQYKKYMKEVEGIDLDKIPNKIINICENCNGTDFQKDNSSRTSCLNCGCVFNDYEIDDKPCFKDMARINIAPTTFTYKRENHFNEWLDSLEATGKNDVPTEVLDHVRYELKKQRFTDPNKITAVHIRAILKKLKFNNYYDCIPKILSIVIGRPPLVIPDDLRIQLKKMFREVHHIYHEHAPKHRSNFFSYPYILYKFCELLDADFVLPYLTLLKSNEKLYQQDQIFKSICNALQWEFIKTI